jgi:general stress protein 26
MRQLPTALPADELRGAAMAVIQRAKFPMIATCDGDQPRVRPVSPLRVDGFTVYFANLRHYGKTAELAANRKVELCYLDENHHQVRITGSAVPEENRALLEELWQGNALLRQYLGSLDNPELIIYRVDPERVRFMQEWALEYQEVPLS